MEDLFDVVLLIYCTKFENW